MDKNQIQQAITQIPQQEQTQGAVVQQAKNFPIIHTLPSKLISNLPEIVKLEISQLKLRQAPQNEVDDFANSVLRFLNPKFENQTEVQASVSVLRDFAKTCSLTANEMLKALEMASKKRLMTEDFNGNATPVKLYPEVHRLKLDEIEHAYCQYKQADYQHTKGIKMISQMKEEKQEKKLSDEDKTLMFFTSIISDFEYFKTHKKLDLFASRHYYPLYHLGVLPKHDEDFRQQIKVRVLQVLQKDLAQTYNRNERKFLKQIIESQMTNEGRFKTKAHELIVSDFFEKLIDEGKSISDILREKTNGKNYAEIVQMIKY